MKKYISFSGGVESRTMALLYGNNATLLMSDTGAEHSVLFDSVTNFYDYVKSIHPSIELVVLTAKAKHKGVEVNGLMEYMNESKFFPSPQQRFCTRMFKVAVLDEYLKDKGGKLMIGFNYGERERTGNLEKLSNVIYDYPLIRAGWDRQDCEDYLKFHGVHPSFPAYMSRGGCKMCFFKSVKEYKAMYYLNRAEFNEVKQLEESLQDKRGKFYAIHSSGKTMQQIENECKNEIPFDFNEIYKESIKKTTCGAFCMR
jgi:3'-phosphoadenosine 5'-phosphosulfate sulfotransferase (PAPS reductase)/FAD synthetase